MFAEGKIFRDGGLLLWVFSELSKKHLVVDASVFRPEFHVDLGRSVPDDDRVVEDGTGGHPHVGHSRVRGQ